jgi:abortive infection bacteriophage resistance protein
MADLPEVKSPTTYTKQVEILRGRGLGIPDADEAVKILKQVNYYRLSAYMLSLKDDDRFIAGTTISNVYNLYEFDRKLRNLLMSTLENIEIAFRTHIAYMLAHDYGTLGYLDAANFSNPNYHKQFIEQLNHELSRSNELFIAHHQSKYRGQIPIWVAVEIMSFSTLSKLYSNLKNKDRDRIASEYYNLPHIYIASWLRVLSVVRNVCAHYGRLYGRRFRTAPRLDKKDAKLGFDSNRIFAAIFVMKKLTRDKQIWMGEFVSHLQALIEQYSEVDCSLIGFSENWDKLLTISDSSPF